MPQHILSIYDGDVLFVLNVGKYIIYFEKANHLLKVILIIITRDKCFIQIQQIQKNCLV